METGKMRNSVSMVLLMLMSTFAAIDIPEAKASEVVSVSYTHLTLPTKRIE